MIDGRTVEGLMLGIRRGRRRTAIGGVAMRGPLADVHISKEGIDLKKLTALALGVLFVLGFAAYAFAADVEFGGDMRVRGIYKQNYDFNDKANDDLQYWDQRLRMTAKVKAGDGVEVNTRLTLSDGKWDGTANTGGSATIAGEDYAYITVPIEKVTLNIGRQHSDWGNKFLSWNVAKDRAKVTYKMDDTLTLGGYTDKGDETDGSGDNDAYGLFAINKMGDWKAALLGVYAIDAKESSNKGDDVTGFTLDVAFNGKASDVNIFGEFVYQGGDKYDASTMDKNGKATKDGGNLGFFVHADKNINDQLNVGGALAMASGGYQANRYFTPTLFFGSSGELSIMNFGNIQFTDSAGKSHYYANDMMYAIVLAASYKVNSPLTVGAKFAYADLSSKSFEQVGMTTKSTDPSVMEFDVTGSYAITKNTTWYANLGFLMPSDDLGKDNAVGASHKIEVKF